MKEEIQTNEETGMIQIDWRIPPEAEQAWKDSIQAFGEPRKILKYLVGSFRRRKRFGKISALKFDQVRVGDSRKRIKVLGFDYWEAQSFARGFNVSVSSFLSSILYAEWKETFGFRSDKIKAEYLEEKSEEERNAEEKIKDFPVQKGSLLPKGA
ncbi:hypothetical protein EHQ53_00790 [Leptospira langatensis]|uniref:DUF1564 family protein n=1 Tax=Leptospira langatensis TaxID=2484983 RepID=A0A5F1ZWH6_9LEPT|nr:hypothetical protein [Leptospira langatensis]TGJ98298.1 hypothetical protein EHO57_16935 [Leptospira langatensis]TGL43212.1 hypothetical protein EHQ53_00790 [Leptospira langatensis]